MNYTWPFASLTVDEEGVQLSISGKRKRFPKEHLKRIETVKGIVSDGIRFTPEATRHEFIFWSFNRSALLDALEARGYEVSSD